jgi:hypothetical protein
VTRLGLESRRSTDDQAVREKFETRRPRQNDAQGEPQNAGRVS